MGKIQIFFKNNQICHSVLSYKFNPIKHNHLVNNKFDNKVNWIPDSRIGVFDIETYFDDNHHISKVLALGFHTALHTKPITYYINNELVLI